MITRSDFLLQDIRNNAFPIGRENEALEHLPLALSLAEAPRKVSGSHVCMFLYILVPIHVLLDCIISIRLLYYAAL